MKAFKSTSRGQGRLGDQPSEGQVFAPAKPAFPPSEIGDRPQLIAWKTVISAYFPQ